MIGVISLNPFFALPSLAGECSSPHVKVIYICPAPVSTKLCPHMQLCRPVICLPLLLFSVLGCHSVSPSVIVSPDYVPRPSPFGLFYFRYYVFDFGFISFYRVSDFLSCSVIFGILLSLVWWAVLSFCSRYFVVEQVSKPYVIVGNTHTG